MPVGESLFAVRPNDALWIVVASVLRALSGDASIAEDLGVSIVSQNLQPVGHLVLEFNDAGVVIAGQARPLQVNVAKPAGVMRTGCIVRSRVGPSRLIGCSVSVNKVPTVSSFGSNVGEGDRRIVADLLLDIK